MFKFLSKYIEMPTLVEFPRKPMVRFCPLCLGKFSSEGKDAVLRGDDMYHLCQLIKGNNKWMKLHTRANAKTYHELMYKKR